MAEIRIIKMTEQHLTAVAVIEQNVFHDPWTYESFVEVMSLSPYCWVAVDGETVVGYLLTQWVLDEVHILNIAVAADLHRKGIGASLIEFVQKKAQMNGMQDMFLEVRMSNTAAMALYRRFGFEDVAVRKKYYADGEDALVMHCRIPDADFTDSDEAADGTDNER